MLLAGNFWDPSLVRLVVTLCLLLALSRGLPLVFESDRVVRPLTECVFGERGFCCELIDSAYDFGLCCVCCVFSGTGLGIGCGGKLVLSVMFDACCMCSVSPFYLLSFCLFSS